ncbi:peptidylprolyl isomerase [Alkalicella caledoniensis]|uniref:Peptidylprolyl isomerase n=1 Tax=Alkalicella caledoniensis TaxID=2731377 RepID=A0A7G9W858_ALKCA|nr:peptidylprolyl isomerase [Alkalicella caledoniensis]QNO14870.1 peptidylprolyl isomerase [Alkalicella caledoniensis]
MAKRIIAITILSVMLVAVLSGCFQSNDKGNGIVAVIDGREITQEEFNKYLYASDSLYSNDTDFTAEQMNQFLEYFINEELFYTEALKQGIEVNQELIDEQFDEYKKTVLELHFDNNQSTFNSRMRNLGLDEEYLKEQIIVRNVVITEFIEKLREEVQPVSSSDVQSFYDENVDEIFTHDEMRTIRHILVKSEDVAKALLKRLQAGEDFAELAVAYSTDAGTAANGGILDPAEEKNYVEPFGEVAFSLEIGELSDVVQTQHGFHILEVLEIEPAGVRELDGELAEQIFGYLNNQNKENVVVNLLNDLREKANVEKKLG